MANGERMNRHWGLLLRYKTIFFLIRDSLPALYIIPIIIYFVSSFHPLQFLSGVSVRSYEYCMCIYVRLRMRKTNGIVCSRSLDRKDHLINTDPLLLRRVKYLLVYLSAPCTQQEIGVVRLIIPSAHYTREIWMIPRAKSACTPERMIRSFDSLLVKISISCQNYENFEVIQKKFSSTKYRRFFTTFFFQSAIFFHGVTHRNKKCIFPVCWHIYNDMVSRISRGHRRHCSRPCITNWNNVQKKRLENFG